MKKKALLTGASEGIGRAIARHLAKEGFTLTLVARNSERLESLLLELEGDAHQILKADLSSAQDLEKIRFLFQNDHYTLLVNNAGQGANGPFAERNLEDNLHILNLNVHALMTLSHYFLKESKKGDALVNISSTLAFLPLPKSATYAATKAFVTSFSEALWREQKDKGVYVMNLCPGLTTSEFFQRAGGNRDRPPQWMFQSPDDVAKELCNGLRKRCKPTIISGKRNRFLAFLPRLLTRKFVVTLLDSSG